MSAQRTSALGDSLEPDLTPAASETLDWNLESIRLQILHEVARLTRDSDHRARKSDVESAVNNIGIVDATFKVSRISWVATTAILLAAVSLVVQGSILASESGEVWLIGVGALMAGVSTGVSTIVTVQEARRRKRRSRNSSYEFLRSFDGLESRIREHARELLGSDAETGGLGRAISAVELMQLWTPEDSQIFRRLVALRNAIVHEDGWTQNAEIAIGFSQISRLTDLLKGGTATGAKGGLLSNWTEFLQAKVFEERVANALRRASANVAIAQGRPGYDLLVGDSDSLKRVIIKYRKSGILTTDDIGDIPKNTKPGIPTIVVTNVEVSPYASEYLDLSTESETKAPVSIVSWPNQSDIEPLVKGIQLGYGT